MKKSLLITLVTLFAGSSVSTTMAQAAPAAPAKTDPAQLALKYAEVIGKNRTHLAGYSWQNRVEVAKGDAPQYVDLVEARYDTAGQLQTTQVNHDLKIKQRHGILLGAGQEDNLREMESKVGSIRATILSYVYMSRGKIVDFFDKATTAPAQGYEGVIRVQGKNVLFPGDSVILHAHKDAAVPMRLYFTSPFEGKHRITATVDFRYLRNSDAFVPSRIIATYRNDDDEPVTVHLESFDFQKQL